jgi:hypothetical protein
VPASRATLAGADGALGAVDQTDVEVPRRRAARRSSSMYDRSQPEVPAVALPADVVAIFSSAGGCSGVADAGANATRSSRQDSMFMVATDHRKNGTVRAAVG